MNRKIIAVLGFDMETDIGSWTPYYEGLKNGTPRILHVLSGDGVRATFYFTGEAARENPDVISEVVRETHEVGCHSLYHETVGDELFPIPGVKPLLAEEVPLRIKTATDFVQEVLQEKVYSFRAPRLWGSTAVACALEDLGYRTDASYPLYFYRERLKPYHPNRKDWTKQGDMKLLEIPNFADLTMKSSDPYGRDMDQWPLFRTEGSKSLMKRIRSYTEYVSERGIGTVVLCFYFHPWEFVPMPTGLIHYGEGSVLPDPVITQNCGDYALSQLRELIRMLREEGAEFRTALDLADMNEWY